LSWKTARRISQTVFLLAFVALLISATAPLEELLPVEIFLRLDPLLAAAGMLSARAWIGAFVPALAVVAMTVLLGRFFCGWVCPLGTTLDVFDRLFLARSRRRAEAQPRMAQGKVVTLVAGLVLAALGVQVIGWIDPLCLATRAYGGVLLPVVAVLGDLGVRGLDGLGAPEAADAIASTLGRRGLAADPAPTYGLQPLDAAILATVLLLSRIRKRFWCRSLCPLGGGLALLSRWRLVGPRFTEGCSACSRCERTCPTGALTPLGEEAEAFPHERASDPGECTQCMTCLTSCREGGIVLGRPARRPAADVVRPDRRAFLGAAVAAGAAAPLIVLDSRRARASDLRTIRPPGAQDETRFLNLCVRCGQCSRICPTGGLQPSWTGGGIEGLLSPRLVPRHVQGAGHCEFECNLCGQVCPTGAIPPLPLAEKQTTPIGLARFDRSRCIPWERDENCAVCEEHCPTPEKAIEARPEIVASGPRKGQTVLRPRVVADRCIGCGTCEAVCPLPGPAAIRVERPDLGGG
jgi:ferredoxin